MDNFLISAAVIVALGICCFAVFGRLMGGWNDRT